MPELIRPLPPVAWRDRWAGLASRFHPLRLAAMAVAVAIVAAGAWWLLRSSPPPVEARLPLAAGATAGVGTASRTSVAITTDAAGLVVQAAGAVVAPGVYHLVAGARVTDLVRAAGGVLPDADVDAVPLAAKLIDGQRVYVPRHGEAVSATAGGPGPSPPASPSMPLDLNTATVEELDGLPGVGPTTAAAIVAQRDEHGPYHRVDDLLEVRGIGPARLEQLRGLVRV